MVLTERQRSNLEGAVLEYLKDNNYSAYDVFRSEVQSNVQLPKFKNYLEKKWTTVVKLEKKIQDYEKRIVKLEKELKNTNPASSIFSGRNRNNDSVPNAIKCELKGHRKAITHVGFHPSFNMLVSSSEDCTLRVWDPDSSKLERILKGHSDSVNHFDFHPDGSKLASCSTDLSVKIWAFDSNFSCLRTLSGHEHTVSQVRFIEGGDKLVSCSRDTTIRIWETDTGYCIKVLQGHTDWVRKLCCNVDSSILGSASFDLTIRIWDTATGNCRSEIRGFEMHIECIVFGNLAVDKALHSAPEESGGTYEPQFLAAGSRDMTVRLYKLDTGEPLLILHGHNNWVRELIFHPNGKFLLSVSDDRSIRVWDLTKRRTFYTLDDAHELFVQSLSWNPMLPMIATGGADKVVKVWDCS